MTRGRSQLRNPHCCTKEIARQGMRSELWLFQMNDEQRGIAISLVQPAGPGQFLRPAALLLAYVAQLHYASAALLDKKIGPAVRVS